MHIHNIYINIYIYIYEYMHTYIHTYIYKASEQGSNKGNMEHDDMNSSELNLTSISTISLFNSFYFWIFEDFINPLISSSFYVTGMVIYIYIYIHIYVHVYTYIN
jgi:hypothetical protein